MSSGGKGSRYRPVDKKKFNENWERIFGKDKEKNKKEKDAEKKGDSR